MAHRNFILLILNFCLVAGQTSQYVLKGTEAKLLPSKTVSQPEEILWKHDGDKVIEFDGSEEKVFGQYENRVTLLWDSAELIIADVRYEDSGLYELDAFIKGKLHHFDFRLTVIDKVTKPVVSCKLMDESLHNTSGPQARLMCSSGSEQPQDLKFKWHSNGKEQPGQELTISVGDKHDDDEHSCTVSNVVHTETTTFTTKECYPEESSALTVSLVVALVLLLVFAICAALFYFRERLLQACLRRGRSDDVEKQKGELNETATHEERSPLVHRKSTLPSKQPLRNFPQSPQNDSDQDPPKGSVKKKREFFESYGQATPSRPAPRRENDTKKCQEPMSSPALLTNQLPRHQDLNADEDKDPQVENLAPNVKESEPADDAVQSSEDEQSELLSPAASEQPGSEKEEDENEEIASHPSSAVSSHTASPHSPLSQSAQIKETKDTDDEHKNDGSSDEVSEQTEEKNIRESDSSGAGEINESGEPGEKKQSTIPEHKGSEILSQKDEKSPAENECGSESEIAKVTNPSLDTTRSGLDLDQESNKVRQESKGQSDNSAAKDDKNNNQGEEKNDVECGSADEEPGNDHPSQDEKEQKADAVS
ncbi:uncharacterized protein LOC115411814 isoform X2 [Sphaeramia orbicularis]|uniref:Uncharacterized LOC115411814 n=1 Tax=Sphaeramia orbicularis TaxID=375764 RepID=A0A673AXA6_9TELE|nr:uncharacterized protein LOC115411814 isoform X2 [Sphaeramia orbicularis]